jgi:hypothetical protein
MEETLVSSVGGRRHCKENFVVLIQFMLVFLFSGAKTQNSSNVVATSMVDSNGKKR